MENLFEKIVELIKRNEILISDHGYDELAEDDIFIDDVVHNVVKGTLIETYPEYSKGPCILVLQEDCQNRPIHVVWGIPKGRFSPAVLVTAYRPTPEKWSGDFKRRIK